jgi:putative membrane protein
MMLRLLIEWVLSAVALVITAFVVPGFEVAGLGPAMVAALVVALLQVLFGMLLGLMALPLFGAAAATAPPGEHSYSVPAIVPTILMLLFNALVLWVAAKIVSGFRIKRFLAAFIGAIVLLLIHVGMAYVWPR